MATEIDNIGHSSGGGHDNLTLAIVETKLNSIQKEKMSKRIKQILALIGMVCVISLIANIYLSVSMSGYNEKELVRSNKALENRVDSITKVANKLTKDTTKFRNVLREIELQLKDENASNLKENIEVILKKKLKD